MLHCLFRLRSGLGPPALLFLDPEFAVTKVVKTEIESESSDINLSVPFSEEDILLPQLGWARIALRGIYLN